MTCIECIAARECNGLWRRFDNLACIHCAARLIQMIVTFPIAKTVASERRVAALKASVDAGMDEATIRKLVKGPTAYAPPPEKKGKQK